MSFRQFIDICPDCQGAAQTGDDPCPTCEGDGHIGHGSLETFYADRALAEQMFGPDNDIEAFSNDDLVGWYWWACFPGCLPDGDPSGPFETEQEALDDANNS